MFDTAENVAAFLHYLDIKKDRRMMDELLEVRQRKQHSRLSVCKCFVLK